MKTLRHRTAAHAGRRVGLAASFAGDRLLLDRVEHRAQHGVRVGVSAGVGVVKSYCCRISSRVSRMPYLRTLRGEGARPRPARAPSGWAARVGQLHQAPLALDGAQLAQHRRRRARSARARTAPARRPAPGAARRTRAAARWPSATSQSSAAIACACARRPTRAQRPGAGQHTCAVKSFISASFCGCRKASARGELLAKLLDALQVVQRRDQADRQQARCGGRGAAGHQLVDARTIDRRMDQDELIVGRLRRPARSAWRPLVAMSAS